MSTARKISLMALRFIAAILCMVSIGCGGSTNLGGIKASIEIIDGQKQCVLESQNMTLRQVVDAVEPFVQKKISLGPSVNPDQHIADVRVIGRDWKTVLDRLAVHAGNMSVTETDHEITIAQHPANTATALSPANQPMQPSGEVERSKVEGQPSPPVDR